MGGWYVDAALSQLQSKCFEASVLRARCDTGIRIAPKRDGMVRLRGLPGGLPPHVDIDLKDLRVRASWDGKDFLKWPEAEEVGVQMFALLDPRLYHRFIGAERVARASATRAVAQYNYKVRPLLDSLKLPKATENELLATMGEERDITFDIESNRLISTRQRDLYPLEDEISVIILQDC